MEGRKKGVEDRGRKKEGKGRVGCNEGINLEMEVKEEKGNGINMIGMEREWWKGEADGGGF